MLQREEDGIAKPNPGNQSQYQQSVSRWRLVDVQNETRIKKLRKSILQKNYTTIIITSEVTRFSFTRQMLTVKDALFIANALNVCPMSTVCLMHETENKLSPSILTKLLYKSSTVPQLS